GQASCLSIDNDSTGGTPVPLSGGGQRPPLQLTAKEQLIHDQGLVSVLKQLHDELDAAVFAAYSWPATLTDAEILERLVALNAERAREEANGVIRWLRPEYQARDQKSEVSSQQGLTLPEVAGATGESKIGNLKSKIVWPKALSERVQAVEGALRVAGAPVSAEQLAKGLQRAKPADVAEILETLVTLGRAKRGSLGFEI
ncbi:MAG: hypothetical protein NTY01_02590, partial [Verrucomicrobia bacterium]|nr:hypothetical protein [Verrucomicrobiota bacterium]